MRSKILAVGAISLCGAWSGGVSAQSAPTPTTSGIDSQSDNEKDMTLALAEVKTAASAHFDKLNKDGDATLETNEVRGAIRAKLFKAADTDNDGSVTKDEYLALVETLFKQADADNDGTLSVGELTSKSARQLKTLID